MAKFDLLAYAHEKRKEAEYFNSPVLLIEPPGEFSRTIDSKLSEYLNDIQLQSKDFSEKSLRFEPIKLDGKKANLIKMRNVRRLNSKPMDENMANHLPTDSEGLKTISDPREYFSEKFFKTNNKFSYAENIESSFLSKMIGEDPRFSGWNLDNLNNDLKKVSPNIPGITKSMTYFGTLGNRSSSHDENLALGSVSYLSPRSESKLWLCVENKYHAFLIKMGQQLRPNCNHPFSHKDLIVPIETLETFGIPYYLVNQKAGCFVIVFYGVNHSVVNIGNNLAEAVNFAGHGWEVIGNTCNNPFAHYTYTGWKPILQFMLYREKEVCSLFRSEESLEILSSNHNTFEDHSSQTTEPEAIGDARKQISDTEEDDPIPTNRDSAAIAPDVDNNLMTSNTGNVMLSNPPSPVILAQTTLVQTLPIDAETVIPQHVLIAEPVTRQRRRITEIGAVVNQQQGQTMESTTESAPRRMITRSQLNSTAEAARPPVPDLLDKVRKTRKIRHQKLSSWNKNKNKTATKPKPKNVPENRDAVLNKMRRDIQYINKKIKILNTRQQEFATAIGWFDFNERIRLMNITKSAIGHQRDLYKVVRLFFTNNHDLKRLLYAQGYADYDIIKDYFLSTDRMRTALLEAFQMQGTQDVAFWISILQTKESFNKFFEVSPELRRPVDEYGKCNFEDLCRHIRVSHVQFYGKKARLSCQFCKQVKNVAYDYYVQHCRSKHREHLYGNRSTGGRVSAVNAELSRSTGEYDFGNMDYGVNNDDSYAVDVEDDEETTNSEFGDENELEDNVETAANKIKEMIMAQWLVFIDKSETYVLSTISSLETKFAAVDFIEIMNAFKTVMKEISSDYRRKNLIKMKNEYVGVKEITLEIENRQHRGIIRQVEKKMAYIPIKATLMKLLSCENFANSLIMPSDVINNVSITHPFKSKRTEQIMKEVDGDFIGIILGVDDFNVLNGPSEQTNRHKLTAGYMKILNEPDEICSENESTYLTFLANSYDFKTDRMDNYRKYIVADLKELENGVEFVHKGIRRKLPVILFAIVADNLAANEIYGLKLKFVGDNICRNCTISKDEYLEFIFLEKEKKTKDWYNEVIADESKWSENNIVAECPFNELKYYHICDAPVADLMHNVPEGHGRLLMGKVLTDIINARPFNFERLKACVKDFDFQFEERRNPLPVLSKEKITTDRGLIGFTASQMIYFMRILPLMIGKSDLIRESTGEILKSWTVYMKFQQIMDIIFSTSITPEQLQLLPLMLTNYFRAYKEIDGKVTIKTHYVGHSPEIIIQCGPFRPHLWTMRLESFHRVHKTYAKRLAGCNNLSVTLARHYQLSMVQKLALMQDENYFEKRKEDMYRRRFLPGNVIYCRFNGRRNMIVFVTVKYYKYGTEDALPVVFHDQFNVFEVKTVKNLVTRVVEVMKIDSNVAAPEIHLNVDGRTILVSDENDFLYPNGYYVLTFVKKGKLFSYIECGRFLDVQLPSDGQYIENSSPVSPVVDDSTAEASIVEDSYVIADISASTPKRKADHVRFFSPTSDNEPPFDDEDEEEAPVSTGLRDLPLKTPAKKKRKAERLSDFADDGEEEISSFFNSLSGDEIVNGASLLVSISTLSSVRAAIYVLAHRAEWHRDACRYADLTFRKWTNCFLKNLSPNDYAAGYSKICSYFKINYGKEVLDASIRCNKRLDSLQIKANTRRIKYSMESEKEVEENVTKLAREIDNAGNDKTQLDVLFKRASPIIVKWINYLQKKRQLEKGQATVVLRKFKFLKQNCAYLHHTFLEGMQVDHPNILSLSNVFDKYISKIFKEGQRKNVYSGPQNVVINGKFDACDVLCRLIREHCTRDKECMVSSFIIDQKDKVALNSAILDAGFNKAYPRLCLVNSGEYAQHFIIMENDAFKVQGNFLIALQTLLDVFYVTNLEYDPKVKAFFDILEFMVNIVRGYRPLLLSQVWDQINSNQK
uniref:JmjC domain-containing protein n=1 Tax=Panagrolaimus sp. JU765 TaxID=591449 RepID=A0AC34Q340_9BILA